MRQFSENSRDVVATADTIFVSPEGLANRNKNDKLSIVNPDSEIPDLLKKIDASATSAGETDAKPLRRGERNIFSNVQPIEVDIALAGLEEEPDLIYKPITNKDFEQLSKEAEIMIRLTNNDSELNEFFQANPILKKIFDLSKIKDPKQLELEERHLAADIANTTDYGDSPDPELATEHMGNIYRLVENIRKNINEKKAGQTGK